MHQNDSGAQFKFMKSPGGDPRRPGPPDPRIPGSPDPRTPGPPDRFRSVRPGALQNYTFPRSQDLDIYVCVYATTRRVHIMCVLVGVCVSGALKSL